MAGSDSPVVFEPIFKERIWGGRNLAASFGKKLPANKRIGESWEIVDRPEAQSIVRAGPLAGRSLHDLWVNFREELFGRIRDPPRFSLLIKLLRTSGSNAWCARGITTCCGITTMPR